MKKILLILISLSLGGFNIKAELIKGEIQRVYNEGKRIREIIETRLAVEFKRQSDKILTSINPAYLQAEEDYKYIFSAEGNNKALQDKTFADSAQLISAKLNESISSLNQTLAGDLRKVLDPNSKLDISELVNAGLAEFQKQVMQQMILTFSGARQISNKVAASNVDINQVKERVSKIVSFDNLAKARMQANYQVNLNNVLLSVIDHALFNGMNKFLSDAEAAVKNIMDNGSIAFDSGKALSRECANYIYRTPSMNCNLQELVRSNYFVHSNMRIKRDQITCSHCKVEVSGLQETDQLQYYHKYNCKLFAEGKIKVDQNSDAKLTAQQRIKVFGQPLLRCDEKTKETFVIHNDTDSTEPIIDESISKYLSDDFSKSHEDVIWLISAYSDLRTRRLDSFIKFYSALAQLPGWILVYEYVNNPNGLPDGTIAVMR